ncbi:aminotransferase-like domain-containing protein [Lentilactobacillus hilgardii]|uniref:Aminotransferase, class I/II n=1 Tax=Lentilactobacillus hilgardii (strain ATCC 8290 / DSM 20176 / CCUG 30140 / JCM 1155 / KCTC 3500 / NBRC 15886 / NCIMB 8040 / NRRL B-1843 / 9) TaxID=1423757 RepID=C0XIC3_LENH9|nr:PLP-dependent aminotransferase family protein [Lentilactobacillus hilgardii]EEI24867.1 aminotransferase, class I/II [Lentilactobacillus hilgardii DSM 20176 = ATCC 8290]KRK54089.1 2-aminoadipate transaminase [Lentilactobacillus hilgardii DSM 20176 = ATCC 8290]MCP9332420.1 PLP-dependent aminotransferase family protein [Lentilactobacillus hilgardii]MCP9348940.1 PLP-dependent aminotransferase family protein [Lentilactobacillus hilgardii]MCP9351834.1 PLP-dependent aminotransferase family protein
MTYQFSDRVPESDEDPVGNILKVAGSPDVISFAGGLPAPELFPVAELKRVTDEVYDESGRQALQYSTAIGYPQLREQIVKRMAHQGVKTTIDNIMISTGSQQSIDLTAKMFVNPGDTVIVEKPTYLCALDVFRSYGAHIVGVDMDENGMKIDQLEKAVAENPNTKFIYTIPNFQNPTGRTMSADRRERMIEIADNYDIMIVEDDPYGAIRFAGDDIEPIKFYDDHERVIYLSTFSKILAPGLRLGWIVAEKSLIKKFTLMKQSADVHSDNLTQHIVAKFMSEYDIDDHIDKIKQVYRKRERVMMNAIEAFFPKNVHYSHPEGGLFIWVEVPGDVDTKALFDTCIKHNVAFVPGEPFYPDAVTPGTFRLNYSNMSEDHIKTGIKRLGDAIKETISESVSSVSRN